MKERKKEDSGRKEEILYTGLTIEPILMKNKGRRRTEDEEECGV